MSSDVLPLVASLLSLAGAFLFLAAAIGLLRLPDFYSRTHAPTKAACLGLVLLASGSMAVHLGRGGAVWLEDLVLIVFVVLTVPVSSQMLVRGAAARRVPQSERASGEPPSRPIERLE